MVNMHICLESYMFPFSLIVFFGYDISIRVKMDLLSDAKPKLTWYSDILVLYV